MTRSGVTEAGNDTAVPFPAFDSSIAWPCLSIRAEAEISLKTVSQNMNFLPTFWKYNF